MLKCSSLQLGIYPFPKNPFILLIVAIFRTIECFLGLGKLLPYSLAHIQSWASFLTSDGIMPISQWTERLFDFTKFLQFINIDICLLRCEIGPYYWFQSPVKSFIYCSFLSLWETKWRTPWDFINLCTSLLWNSFPASIWSLSGFRGCNMLKRWANAFFISGPLVFYWNSQGIFREFVNICYYMLSSLILGW